MTSRTARAACVVAGAAAGAALLPRAFYPLAVTEPSLPARLLVVGIGWAFIAAGVVAWGMRREDRTGTLMVAVGFAWWATAMIALRVPLLWTVGSTLSTLFMPILFCLVLSFPGGRLQGRLEQAVVAWSALTFLVGSVAFAPFYDPATFGCGDCPPGLNLLLVADRPELVNEASRVSGYMQIIGLLALGVLLLRRWATATRPARSVLWPIAIPTLGYVAASLAYQGFQRLADVTIYEAPILAYKAAVLTLMYSLLLMPITFLIGLARVATKRARIGDLVVQLGDLPSPDRLRDSLARALGDDSLQVGLWASEEDGYVTPDGKSLDMSTPDGTRTATLLERHGQPLAVLLHDPALLDDPGLVAAVTAAARLAVENERLQEEVMQQLAEVHASRARLVEAADAERRRIERNLHDGAQQRLVSLCLALRLSERQLEQGQGEELRRSLAEAATELEEALAELRELARGTFPAILTQFGLAAALGAVAGRSQAPVDVDVQSIEGLRFSERVEAAGYFIVAEALTNVARYSGATHAQLHVGFDGVELLIQVTDNGRGGADPQRGGGLRGLADRVHALEGSLELQSPEGSGTTITVRLPADPRMADV